MKREENKQVGTMICPSCHKKTPVKVNKNGSLYIYCVNEINAETGDKCFFRVTFGRAHSRKALRENNIEKSMQSIETIDDNMMLKPAEKVDYLKSTKNIDIKAWGQ